MQLRAFLYTDRLSTLLEKYNMNEIYVKRNLGVVINIEGVIHCITPSNECLQTLIQVILQLAAAARMTQFAQSFGLNLTNTLTGNMELFANFF